METNLCFLPIKGEGRSGGVRWYHPRVCWERSSWHSSTTGLGAWDPRNCGIKIWVWWKQQGFCHASDCSDMHRAVRQLWLCDFLFIAFFHLTLIPFQATNLWLIIFFYLSHSFSISLYVKLLFLIQLPWSSQLYPVLLISSSRSFWPCSTQLPTWPLMLLSICLCNLAMPHCAICNVISFLHHYWMHSALSY